MLRLAVHAVAVMSLLLGGFAAAASEAAAEPGGLVFARSLRSDPDGSAGPPPSAAPDARRRRGANDARRTVRSYPLNLAYNFLGVLTPGNHKPLLVTTLITLPAIAWDDEAVGYFGRHPHRRWASIGRVMGGGIAVGGLTVGLFSAGRIAHPDRVRAATYDLSQAVIVNFSYTYLLKLAVHRQRPDESSRQSFPSGHASNAFAAATVISRHYKKLAVPSYTLASYIALSRLAASKHHFSDVVAGAGIGFGVGRVVVRRNSRPPAAHPQPAAPSLMLLPDRGPAGDGVGASLRLAF
jgi:membrane-associated phospholipid phosphatase